MLFYFPDFRNLALGQSTSQPPDNSLVVDGFLDTCTVLNGSLVPEWVVKMNGPVKIELVGFAYGYLYLIAIYVRLSAKFCNLVVMLLLYVYIQIREFEALASSIF